MANTKSLGLAILSCWLSLQAGPPSLGQFEGHSDIGTVLHPGTIEYDPGKRTYTVTGSGENMWFATDDLHFVWKKVSGDVTLTADVSFAGSGGNAHRKAVLMIRQSLDTDSAYADAALHGNGLTSIQGRDEKGGITREVQSYVSAPRRLRILKRGDYAFVQVALEGEDLHLSGGSMRLALKEPFYVGIGVCAHDKDAVEKAVFSNVEVTEDMPVPGRPPALFSTLETVPVPGDRRAVYVTGERIEAPNWTRDGASLLFNSNGRIHRVPVAGGKPEPVDTGFATRCDSHHGVSPDGALLAVTDDSQEPGRPAIYIVPVAGGAPRRVTRKMPSSFHGWSPDGKTLVFGGERNGVRDVYAISAAGEEETKLTGGPGVSDNPEYSTDGNYIYFNSGRGGSMQVWRMRRDGSEPEQVTSDEFNNWFPHLSPDGQRIVFLSYEKDVTGHPENQDVTLRMLSLADRKITVLAKLVGGQGTIDAPCWSPDGRRIAFVSYQLIP